MENYSLNNNSFQFTNKQNLAVENVHAFKKALAKRLKNYQTSLAQSSKHLENDNPNLQGGERQSRLEGKDLHRRLAQSELLKAQKPPRFVGKSIRKVNMDFFRGKRVTLKHSNVRISFEIVESLNN